VLDALATAPIDGDERRTAAPASGEAILEVRVAGGVATVDLATDIDRLVSGRDLRDLAAQVVCTLTAQPGIGQVAFTIGGQPASLPTGDGTLATGAVTREDYRALLPET
jgi:spore germination protein GerM